jgi:hypothetical protein
VPPELDYNQLYVYVNFIKPGKHQYIVSYENKIIEEKPVEIIEPPKLDKFGNVIYDKTPERKKEAFVPLVTNVKMSSYH